MNTLDSVYFDTALAEALPRLPFMILYEQVNKFSNNTYEIKKIQSHLLQACGKLCLMWQASIWALEAEIEFYSTTIHEAPALFGSDAVNVRYHLEALVLFARSSCDIASYALGNLLPSPFQRKRYDSFNKLTKNIIKSGPNELVKYLEPLRNSDKSWISIISGTEKGRALRDKISHQIVFPIEYAEYKSNTTKEYPVVLLNEETWMPLEAFVYTLRNGIIDGYYVFEDVCTKYLAEKSSIVDTMKDKIAFLGIADNVGTIQ